MTALNICDGTLGGIVTWYPTDHLPHEQLPEVVTTIAADPHVVGCRLD
ncbi:hypothetical protein [Rhodococcus koreensis]